MTQNVNDSTPQTLGDSKPQILIGQKNGREWVYCPVCHNSPKFTGKEKGYKLFYPKKIGTFPQICDKCGGEYTVIITSSPDPKCPECGALSHYHRKSWYVRYWLLDPEKTSVEPKLINTNIAKMPSQKLWAECKMLEIYKTTVGYAYSSHFIDWEKGGADMLQHAYHGAGRFYDKEHAKLNDIGFKDIVMDAHQTELITKKLARHFDFSPPKIMFRKINGGKAHGGYMITVGFTPDLSTVIHELGHIYMSQMFGRESGQHYHTKKLMSVIMRFSKYAMKLNYWGLHDQKKENPVVIIPI